MRRLHEETIASLPVALSGLSRRRLRGRVLREESLHAPGSCARVTIPSELRRYIRRMNKTWAVASLLFVSGLCALVYQTVWMRELRLVFGASTLAGAAVLAIFMGGLGAGAAVLGKRSDAHEHPI